MTVTAADLALHLKRVIDDPRRLRAAIAGLQLDGTLARPRLPVAPEPPAALVRRRMADVMTRAVSFAGNVTRDDLRAAGFTEMQIDAHAAAAQRLAGLDRMAA